MNLSESKEIIWIQLIIRIQKQEAKYWRDAQESQSSRVNEYNRLKHQTFSKVQHGTRPSARSSLTPDLQQGLACTRPSARSSLEPDLQQGLAWHNLQQGLACTRPSARSSIRPSARSSLEPDLQQDLAWHQPFSKVQPGTRLSARSSLAPDLQQDLAWNQTFSKVQPALDLQQDLASNQTFSKIQPGTTPAARYSVWQSPWTPWYLLP